MRIAKLRGVVRAPVRSLSTQISPRGRFEHEAEQRATVHFGPRRPLSDRAAVGPADAPLPAADRRDFEARLGHDFSKVRIHADARAAALNRLAGTEALTRGDHVFFGQGAFQPDTVAGRHLIAHELVHVTEAQGAGLPPIRGRMILTDAAGLPGGAQDLVNLLGPPAAMDLEWNPATREVAIKQRLQGPPRSDTLAAMLDRIISDPSQDARAKVGYHLRWVVIGAFPSPRDMTRRTSQRIDMADVRALEAGVPGAGVAAAAHELEENYQAHAQAPVRKVGRLHDAHRPALETENDIREELIGPGRRSAHAGAIRGSNEYRAVDHEKYYIVYRIARAGRLKEIADAAQLPPTLVDRKTIEGFAEGAHELPVGFEAALAAVKATLDAAGNELATVRIEGHADSSGSASFNQALSLERAEEVRKELAKLHVDGKDDDRMYTRGLGETQLAYTPDIGANQARNRRVEILIRRPVVPPGRDLAP